MRRRSLLLILGLLALTSMTWAAASPPAMNLAGQFKPLCNCNDNPDCSIGICDYTVNCSPDGDYFLGVCR